MMRWTPWLFATLITLLLFGCGGGGGGDDDASISIDRSSVIVSAMPADAAPISVLTLKARDMPDDGLYLGVDWTRNGIESVGWASPSDDTALIEIHFIPAGQLANGVYRDTVTIAACHDPYCSRHADNSPMTVEVTYTVTGSYSGTVTVSVDRTMVSAAASNQDATAPVESVVVRSSEALPAGVYVQATASGSGVASVSSSSMSMTETRVNITFQAPGSMGSGTFTGSVSLQACFDAACSRPIPGSPLSVTTQYTVTTVPLPEPGLTPIDVVTRTALTHDVVDAEYSLALDSVVMVSSWPSPALHLYDTRSGTVRQVALVKAPTSVSVSPDGRQAAVGHDALVSVVDLTASPLTARPLNVSADVFDLVFDGMGRVHAMPRVDQWVQVHTVDVASNTETLMAYTVYAGTIARLHPSGASLYLADTGLSPSDIRKVDLSTTPTPTYLYDSPYHGDYAMCGNLWFKDDGSTIYTACGNAFRSTSVQSTDMVYAGRLALSTINGSSFLIRSLSQSSITKEIALIEQKSSDCQDGCVTRLALHESDFLNRSAVYSIPPVDVAGSTYAQQGLFVFHRANGSSRVVISRLVGMPNASAEFYLSALR